MKDKKKINQDEKIYDKCLCGKDVRDVLNIPLPLSKMTIQRKDKVIEINPLVIGMKPTKSSRYHVTIFQIDIKEIEKDKKLVQDTLLKLTKKQKCIMYQMLKQSGCYDEEG